MKFYAALLPLLLLTVTVNAYTNAPAPQTASITEYRLPKPFKKATVTASAYYDEKEDAAILNLLKIKIDSQKEIIITKLFEGPRLDTIRVYICPEFMLLPDDLPPSQQITFAITFKFWSRASMPESQFEQPYPTAWIEVKNGKIVNIYETKENRDGPASFEEYDLKTLKPVPRRFPLKNSTPAKRRS